MPTVRFFLQKKATKFLFNKSLKIMTQTNSDYLISRLSEWGINRIFRYPGDGINGLMGALNRQQDKIQYAPLGLQQ